MNQGYLGKKGVDRSRPPRTSDSRGDRMPLVPLPIVASIFRIYGKKPCYGRVANFDEKDFRGIARVIL